MMDLARGWFEAVAGYQPIYHHLQDLLEKRKIYGRGQEVYRDSYLIAKGSGRTEALVFFSLVIDEINRKGYSNVLDIGSGDGRFLIDMCSQNLQVTGYGIDIVPESVELANDRVREAGLEKRITINVFDLGSAEPPPDVT